MKHGGDIYRNKIRLDFSVNLNPLGPPAEVLAAVKASLEKAGCYPDPRQDEIRNAIAEALKIDSSCVYAGNGASELLMAAVRAVNPRKALLFEPGYSGYRHVLDAAGCRMKHQMLREETGFCITHDDLKALEKDTDIGFICDPINPSGKNIAEDVLYEALDRAEQNDTKVILDESFYPMSDKAAERHAERSGGILQRYGNVFIVRSHTKMLAVPGIRIGYVLSSPSNINKIIQNLPEWNLSVTGESAVAAGIKKAADRDYILRTVEAVKKERDYLSRMLKALGLFVYESNTCYILFRGPAGLYGKLLECGILIRDCSDYAGLAQGYYRIAVKNHSDNEILIRNLRGVLNEA